MENEVILKKKKVDKLPSTIIIGIFLIIFIACITIAYSLNLHEIQQEIKNNNEDPNSDLGVAIGLVFVTIIAVIAPILLSIAPVLGGSICLIFAILNKRSSNKVTKIISFVYDGLLSIIIIMGVLRIIFLAVGVF